MMTKAPLPPNFQPPLWATKQFRRLILGGVMGAAVLGVLIFDIGPKLTHRYEREEKPKDPAGFVPQARKPGVPAEVKFEGMLEKVHDGTPMDDQDESYQYLVMTLSRMDAAIVNKEAQPVEYKYFSKMPAETRGHTAKIMALFLKSSPIRVDAAPGGVHFIHRTYLSDLSGSEGYVVDLLEPPPELEQRTLVGLNAVFLKLGTYEGKKGPVQAPLFVGKSLHVIKERMAEGGPLLNLPGGVMLGLAVGMMIVILVLTSLIFRSSKSSGPKSPAISLESLKS